MSETLEAPVTSRQTTFGEIEKKFNALPTPTPEPTQITDTPVVTTPEPTVTDEPVATPEPPQPSGDEIKDTSVVSLSIGDEPANTEPTPTVTPTQNQQTYNWKDEIKKLDRKEVAKELGFSDFALEMDEYLAKGGKAEDYIIQRGINWSNVPDEELVKSDLKKLYPDASQLQIDRLYNKKYNQRDEDLDEDREDGLLLMKADAKKLRDAKIAEQNSFKIPDAIVPNIKDDAYEQWKQNTAQRAAQVENVINFINSHEATKKLNESKRVTINLGEGVAPFNFYVDKPEMITNMWTDDGSIFSKLTTTKQGEPDVEKQNLISLFMYNPQRFIQDIFNYGQQTGRRKLVTENQNAVRPNGVATPTSTNGSPVITGVGKFSDRQR